MLLTIALVLPSAFVGTPAGAQEAEPELELPQPVRDTAFQMGVVDDSVHRYQTFGADEDDEEEEDEDCPPARPNCPGGGRPSLEPVPGAMTAAFSNMEVLPDAGVIGGSVLEVDVTITNTSPDPDVVLSAFAFQSKVSESPALASRIGDKLFYATVIPDAHPLPGDPSRRLGTVKKNGTSNGLYSGRWKGICINSSRATSGPMHRCLRAPVSTIAPATTRSSASGTSPT